jgi:hypothetical protein
VDGFEDPREEHHGHQEEVLDAGTVEMSVGAYNRGGQEMEEEKAEKACSDILQDFTGPPTSTSIRP